MASNYSESFVLYFRFLRKFTQNWKEIFIIKVLFPPSKVLSFRNLRNHAFCFSVKFYRWISPTDKYSKNLFMINSARTMESVTPTMEELTFTKTKSETSFTVTTYYCHLYKFLMSVGLIGSLCIFGIVGNILTLLVFSKFNRNDKKTKSAATLLLSGLTLSDILLLITLFIMKTVPTFISFTGIDDNFFVSYTFVFLIVYGWPCVDVAQSVNTWITVLLAILRFIAIVFPHKSAIHCSYAKARIHLTLICVLIAVYEIPLFLDNKIVHSINDHNNTIYIPGYEQLHTNYWYQLLYKTTFYYIIMYIIPWISLSILTVFLVKAVKQAQQFRYQMGNNPKQRDNTEDINKPLIAVVIASLICRPWEPIRRIIEVILGVQPGCGHYYYYFEEFPSLTSALNSSANFVLHCCFLKKFTQTLKEIFITRQSELSLTSTNTSILNVEE